MADSTPKVKFGRLTQSPKCFDITEGMVLGKFLSDNQIRYSAAIRVNGKTANEQTVLKHGDIITEIENVSGGLI